MPALDGLAELIARLRVMINAPDDTVFSDYEIGNALTQHRWEVRWASLRPSPTVAPGALHYLDYYSDLGGWSSNYVLQNSAYTDITADVTLFEPITGHWHFDSQPQGISVKVTGTVHDTAAAAADLLEWQCAQYALQFDFTSERTSFSRSQQMAALLQLAARYRAQAMPTAGRLVQLDADPASSYGAGPSVVYATGGAAGPWGGGF